MCEPMNNVDIPKEFFIVFSYDGTQIIEKPRFWLMIIDGALVAGRRPGLVYRLVNQTETKKRLSNAIFIHLIMVERPLVYLAH